MIMGIGAVVAGVVLWSVGPTARLYLPIGSMVAVSAVLALLAWIFRQR